MLVQGTFVAPSSSNLLSLLNRCNMDRLAELLTSPKVAIAVLGPIFGLMLLRGCVEMAPSDEDRRRG